MSKPGNFRSTKDLIFESSPQSPLTPEQKKDFKGLHYFDENPAFEFTVPLRRYPTLVHVQMATSTGHVAEYLKYGFVQFEIDGVLQTLQVYKSEEHDELFLPFMDATSGQETYGSGRYLDVQEHADGNLFLNFNLAYNPYCAYNEQWSCPIPPTENRLQSRITAGELKFHS